MDTIKRVDFKKTKQESFDFEIVDLQEFLNTRPKKYLSKISRLNFYMIMYITSGSGKHEIDFNVYDLKEGNMILISKNQVHRFFINNDANGYIIFFTEEYLYTNSESNIHNFLELFDAPLYSPIIEIDTSKDSSCNILIDLIYKEYQSDNKIVKIQLLKSLFRSFMLTISRYKRLNNRIEISSSNYKRFLEFKNLVDSHIKEKKTVQEYADIMLVSKKTINQVTRMSVDISAKQFIIDRIMLEIKRYLGQGEFTINEISDLMGFDEPSNLTKFFKRYEGISPKEFKNKYFYN